ncbi:MAG: DUF4926 domain-containing protein [Candidatus Sumerlaeota bacterium]|nr:DUF4926 domain-containing protein [Candidatus Sumerlaeota bacterium]
MILFEKGLNMIKEHERVVLLKDLSEVGLKKNDVGTVIHIHKGDKAFEVEFMTLEGGTVAIATLQSSDIRPVTKMDITHTRKLTYAI